MFRIGILGSDNSHALAFSKLCNIPDDNGQYLYDDVRIVAIYGNDDDPAHTKQVAEEGKIPLIAKTPNEFYGNVDAVMVVYRRGSLHIKDILPFVEKGYPVWIDKPIAVSIEDVKALRKAVEKNNTLITGGSTLKYNYDILTLQGQAQDKELLGDVKGGSLNFPGCLSNEYDGLFFYGSHLCEMCLSVFGYDIKSIYASAINDGNIAVIAEYEDKQVMLQFFDAVNQYFVTVHGTKGSVTRQLDISIIYKLGFEQFVKMLRSQRMPLSFDELVKPVYMLNAIEQSIKKGVKIEIDSL